MEKAMQINSRKINSFGILIIILLCCFFIFTINILGVFEHSGVEAVSLESTEEKEKLHINQNPIDIESILSENAEKNVAYEIGSEEKDLEYTTIYTENEDLPSGTIHVTQVRNIWS